jgi:hypothetical protein
MMRAGRWDAFGTRLGVGTVMGATERPWSRVKGGEGGGIRTHGQRIKSPLLYH